MSTELRPRALNILYILLFCLVLSLFWILKEGVSQNFDSIYKFAPKVEEIEVFCREDTTKFVIRDTEKSDIEKLYIEKSDIESPLIPYTKISAETVYQTGIRTPDDSTFLPKSETPEEWIILGFTNYKFLAVAQIWFTQLRALGYKNHKLAAMDVQTFEYLSNHGEFKDHVVYSSGATGGELQNIWQKRIDTILSYLNQGINVFVADTDSIWLKYRELSDLPVNVDIFHGDGNPMPQEISRLWDDSEGVEKSFTLCGCIGAYRATVSTINMIDRWSGKCSELTTKRLASKMEGSLVEQKEPAACDDQILLNHLYAYDLKVTWVQLPGFTGVYGKVQGCFVKSGKMTFLAF